MTTGETSWFISGVHRLFPGCLVLWIVISPLLAWIEDEPEEPDYFFLTGGPYTQKRGSPQIIWANQWTWSGEGPGELREYTGAGRFEIGLTDRWEADFEFGAFSLRQGVGETGESDSGVADFLAGARYRLLDESFAPFTLTLGPQVVLPTTSGHGEPGYALDIAAAKDWGGPVFLAASLNVLWTPNVPSGVGGRTEQDVDLTDIGAAMAMAWRALERPTSTGAHHDIHIFLETSWDRTEAPEDGSARRTSSWLISPGLRYGFTSVGGALTEIGVALPVGINRSATDWGWIIQAQFELSSLR